MITSVAVLLVGAGCGVNQAIYNPEAFAPYKPYTYFFPPSERSGPVEICSPKLPPEDQVVTLAEVINIALCNTPTTTQTWAAARAAAATYGKTQAPLVPEIDGVGTYTREKIPALAENAKGEAIAVTSMLTQIQPQLQLTYTLFDFGQRLMTSEIARYALYFADWTHNRTIQTVVQTVTNDYYDYLLQVKLLKAFEADIQTGQTTLDATLAEKMGGTKGIGDVLQAKTLLLQYQLNHAGQKKLVQNAYSTLLKDMGVPSHLPIKFEDLPESISIDIMLKNIDELIANALVLRPDLRAQEADVKSKEAELSLAYRRFFPTLGYQFNWGKTYFQDWIHDKNDWQGVMTLNFPLFTGFSRLNEVRRAKANVDAAEAKLRETELLITKEITTSRTDVVASSETFQYSNEFLESAEKQYEVSMKKYRTGLGDIIDVASAQSSLADARFRHASAIRAWYSALANLIYATGFYTFKPEEVMQ